MKIIKANACVNRIVVGRSQKEYQEDNKDKIKEYKKEYRVKNVEKIKIGETIL